MTEKRLKVAFFVRKEDVTNSDPTALASHAGMQNIDADPHNSKTISGRWGDLDNTQAMTFELEWHYCLVIKPWLSTVFKKIDDRQSGRALPLTEDPLLPLARLFLQAAESLNAEVAFFTTRLIDKVTSDWVTEQYKRVAFGDNPGLVAEHYGMLYLDTYDSRLTDRDVLVGKKGQLIFSGQGKTRWF